jgi:Flp pilus assembly protein TadB
MLVGLSDAHAMIPVVRYAYKASLIGAAHRFELTDEGLSWHIGGRSGVWPYAGISAIRLSYRPVSMQARRFRADIECANLERTSLERTGLERASNGRIAVLSTTWRTASLMAPQDHDYRAFITQLHARMKQAGSQATLTGGLRPRIYFAALVLLVLVAVAMAGLLIRAIAVGEWAGALFLVGFTALFAWQVGGFVARNRPRAYTFDDLPKALLP